MLSKKVYLLSMCLLMSQVVQTASVFAADKPIPLVTNQTGIQPLIKFETDPLVNINLSNAMVSDVLKALSDQVGYNMIISSTSKVTEEVIPRIEFTNIRLSEALSFILRLKKLSIRKLGKTLFIVDESQMNSFGVSDSVVKSYRISNIKPSEAITKLSEFYTAPSLPPKFIASDLTNTISAVLRPTEVEYLDSIMKIIDSAVPQVMIEIKLIELSEQAGKTLGMSYGFGQKQFGGAFNNVGNLPSTLPGSAPVTSGSLSLNFESLRNFTSNFNAQLNALVANSKAKILSSPRIATQNGKAATFQSTETVPVIQSTQTAAGLTQTVNQLPIGENITVTPTLIDSITGYVTLDLFPVISSRGKDVVVNGNPVPETLTRSVKTTMKVKSGEAIVIGGLKRKNNSNASNRIPLLGDIPILGALFGANSWSDSEAELIIMVTPYILDEGGNNPNKTDISSN